MKARAPLVVAALGTILRLVLGLRSTVYLDRLFVPDDTYYTLSIARSIARGLGPTADGVHLTSGFQPLLAYLLVPHPTFACALAIGAIADGLTAYFLGCIAERVRAGAGLVATAIWAVSPTAIETALNGLETSLTLACLTGAVVLWQRKSRFTGVVLGLCLLARVDTVFFVAGLGALMLRRDGVKPTARAAALAAVVVAPHWVYSLVRFHSVIPESGAAVREQAMMYRAAGMVVRDQVALASGAVVGPPFFDSTVLREFLGQTASAVGLIVGILLVAGTAWLAVRTKHDALRLLAIQAGCIFAFYALYLPATWFFRRYLVPVHLLSALLAAIYVRHRAALAWFAIAAVQIGSFAIATPEITVDQRHNGAKGYAQPAQQILTLAPPGATIGAFQSGALGWFADGTGHTIVNLDGVVDAEAAKAFRDEDLAVFAHSRGVTHLADWSVNMKRFLRREGTIRPTFREVGSAEPQGKDERFVLYEIVWP